MAADGDVVLVFKALTFMNLSGPPIAELVRYYRVSLTDLLIVSDDVNLPLGRLRFRPSGSAREDTTGYDRWPTRSAPSTMPGSASGWGVVMKGETWPTMCWPGSTRTSGPGLKARLPGPPTRSKPGFNRASRP